MAERDYVKELEGLKTSLMGYDREAVMVYIRDLIGKKDAEREDTRKEMTERQRQLEAENAGLRAEAETRKIMYEDLVRRMDQMNVSMDKMESYARERDHALDDYHIREQEFHEMESQAREKCDEIIFQARMQAQQKCDEMIREAEAQVKQQKELYQHYRALLADCRDRLSALLEDGEPDGNHGAETTETEQ